ncbi:BTAD domain-containing putative transcriptional regulator [Nocardioides sp. R-C-SC26]|uniref:BTAD domain-containing putative transcriptional regulator n=1 Tax=Nocardioides sp. R-C-SC26 TaxID=2870414 RepID=UPI001E2DB2F0|nr:BTAD domain-containing putative transcriptional regulator [Nocardioides sp. R-C-SC26]
MLEISAFGGVRARLDGRALDLGGPRQRSVLGLLVASGRRTVSVDRFLEELWSGEPPPSAAGALQAYVSRLRAALEPMRAKRTPASVLVSAPPGYALALPDDAVDLWHFERLVRTARAATPASRGPIVDDALALWSDEPLAEYADEEWAAPEIARLRELRDEAVELRAESMLGDGGTSAEAAALVADLEPHVREHPLREPSVALLARALYRAGRQSQALAELAALRERLVDELGLDPSPDLRALEADILRQAEHLAPAPPTTTRVPGPRPRAEAGHEPSPETPRAHQTADVSELVGREDELTRLERAAASVGRRPGMVWVSGEAGVGKSALVNRLCDQSVSAWAVVRGQCPEVMGAPPGLAWAEALRQLGVDVGAAPWELYHLADEVRRTLEARADTAFLVVLEDVHRADDGTLQVLRHVLETTTARALVVATFRAEETGRDLAATLAFSVERTLDRIELTGLAAGAADAVLTTQLGALAADVPVDLRRVLVDRTGGNPLFLRQLGRLVASEGAAVALDAVPVAIRDVLDRRLERLPTTTVDALARVAVLGREVDVDLATALEAEVGELDEDSLADHLDAGLVAGLLENPRPAELRFTHALVRDTCYGRLAPLRRHRMHRAAVAVLERERPDAVEEIARHAAASLDRRSAADALPRLRAAAAAATPHVAVEHLRVALRALDLDGASWGEVFDIRLALVEALANDGDTVAARRERDEAVTLARQEGGPLDEARAWRWPAPLMWSRAPSDVASDRVAELLTLVERIGHDDPAVRIGLLAAAAIEADPQSPATVHAAASEAVELADALGDPVLLCRALNALCLGSFHDAEPHVLAPIAERMLGVAEGAGLHGFVAVARMMLQSVAIGAGDLGEAAEHIQEAMAAGTSGQLPELLLLASIFESTTHLLTGGLDHARRGFAEVTRAIEAAGDANARFIGLWTRFAVEYAAGDTSTLQDAAREMTEELTWHSRDLWVLTLLDAGEVARAREVWHERPPQPMPRDATWLFDAAVRAHVVHALGDVETARVVRDDLLPWSGQLARTLNGALVMGPVDHFLGLLELTLGDQNAAALRFEAARALTGPGGATTWSRSWVRTPTHLRG